jgi:hypothetical protein
MRQCKLAINIIRQAKKPVVMNDKVENYIERLTAKLASMYMLLAFSCPMAG